MNASRVLLQIDGKLDLLTLGIDDPCPFSTDVAPGAAVSRLSLTMVTVFGSTVISTRRFVTSGVIDSWKRPPIYLARNFSAAANIAMLFTGRAKPWPSSGRAGTATG